MTQLQSHSSEPAWNLPELLVRVENDQELLRDLLHIFKEGFPPMLQSLQSALAASDWKNVVAISHKLHGMLSNLAATRAAAAAGELETFASTGDHGAIRGILARLEQETTNLGIEIDAYLNGVRA